MIHVTLAQSIVAASSCAAAWLMVRAGEAKQILSIKEPARCASCGRRRVGRRCQCTSTS